MAEAQTENSNNNQKKKKAFLIVGVVVLIGLIAGVVCYLAVLAKPKLVAFVRQQGKSLIKTSDGL